MGGGASHGRQTLNRAVFPSEEGSCSLDHVQASRQRELTAKEQHHGRKTPQTLRTEFLRLRGIRSPSQGAEC